MDPVNPGKRTHGIVLKEKYDCELPDTDIVTRKFNVEVYEQTGRLEYLEEGIKMGNIDQRANGKKLRTEVTSIEQFNAIGTYGEIAKKYKVSVAMSHALKMSLRAKKLREEKKDEPVAEVVLECSEDEVLLDQGMTEEENMTDEKWDAQKKREWEAQREEWDELHQSDHPENYEHEESEDISEETLKKIDDRTKLLITENEDRWLISGIEAQWADIDASLAEIRRMSIKRLDREIKGRLEMMTGELA